MLDKMFELGNSIPKVFLASNAFSMKGLIIATVIVAITGLVIGILLGFAAKAFEVPVDEKEQKIREFLPGANCGGCGYAGCDACAAAIASGAAAANVCPVASKDSQLAIAEVMGTTVEETEKKVAFVKCAGTCDKAQVNYEYYGVQDCRKAKMAPGNADKKCFYGCMGFGTCVKACAFDALHIVDGIAVVDKEKCTGCSSCTAVCPNSLIDMIPYRSNVQVVCNSKDKGKDVKVACSTGCIGCKICEKKCEYDAIHVVDNLASIDYSKCTNCGNCVAACPVKVINMQSA